MSDDNFDIDTIKYVSFDNLVELWLMSCRRDVQSSKYIQELCAALYRRSWL